MTLQLCKHDTTPHQFVAEWEGELVELLKHLSPRVLLLSVGEAQIPHVLQQAPVGLYELGSHTWWSTIFHDISMLPKTD